MSKMQSGLYLDRREGSVRLSQRLKLETEAEHRQIEQRLALPRESFDRQELVSLLSRFYGYYLPCEAELDILPPGLRSLLGQRRKTPLLTADLKRLGLTPAAIAALPCCQVPAAPTPAEALGRWYVLEGSTLGGQLINRWLRTALGPGEESLFFGSYGDRVGLMWRSYCQLLDEADPRQHDQTVAAAKTTFRTLGAWLSGERP
jgi:heme oxygenase